MTSRLGETTQLGSNFTEGETSKYASHLSFEKDRFAET